MSDDPLKDCPECEEPALRKLVSAAAFKLKGTGWYETDFKDNSMKKPEDKVSDASKKDSVSKTDPSTTKKPKESKPEKKTKPASQS